MSFYEIIFHNEDRKRRNCYTAGLGIFVTSWSSIFEGYFFRVYGKYIVQLLYATIFWGEKQQQAFRKWTFFPLSLNKIKDLLIPVQCILIVFVI